MRKISIISALIVMSVVVFMAFTYQGVPEVKNNVNDIHFMIKNCDDCRHVYYCINGGPIVYPGSCDFYLTVPPDPPIIYTMCVTCGSKTGQAQYDYTYKEVVITVAEGGTICNCSGDSKKKK